MKKAKATDKSIKKAKNSDSKAQAEAKIEEKIAEFEALVIESNEKTEEVVVEEPEKEIPKFETPVIDHETGKSLKSIQSSVKKAFLVQHSNEFISFKALADSLSCSENNIRLHMHQIRKDYDYDYEVKAGKVRTFLKEMAI